MFLVKWVRKSKKDGFHSCSILSLHLNINIMRNVIMKICNVIDQNIKPLNIVCHSTACNSSQ